MTYRLQTAEQRRQFEAFLAAVFALGDLSGITDALREMSPPAPYRIRMKAVYSTGPAERVFDALARDGLFQRVTPRGPGFTFDALKGTQIDSRVFFAVLPTGQPHVAVLVTVAEREEWHLLLRQVRKQYPDLVPIHLSQRELLESVTLLTRRVRNTYDLRVRELSAKETVRTSEGKHVKSVREWTDEDWDKAIAHVSQRRQIITKVAFSFHRRIGETIDVVPTALCKVSKSGEIEFTGRYDLIWSNVVAHVAEAGEKKLSFYAKRGLREREYQPAPLAVTYPQPVFNDLEEVRRLVSVLTKYPKSMHAVQHGNPYAYVQVADIYDGSSFDIWAVSPESITVVPKLKATEAAVARLIQYIFDHFREGTVENYGVKE